MGSGIAGVALAAGAGTRLAPITDAMPKPMCEVATVPLVDLALDRLRTVRAELAVNTHHHDLQLKNHLDSSVHVSHEVTEALGTAGAIARLRDWVSGRPAVVVNADTWCPGSLDVLLGAWDGETTRVLVPGGGRFGPTSAVVGTLLPWSVVQRLSETPSGLFEVVWRPEQLEGRLEVVAHHGPWVDCGTAPDLHHANMLALAGRSVVHPNATVTGAVRQTAVSRGAFVGGEASESVLLPGSRVEPGEEVQQVIRWLGPAGQQTIQL